jgi:NTP pyrophosphatase (non-canonical NTP hydrolase)
MGEPSVMIKASVLNESTGKEEPVTLVQESQFAKDVREELARARGLANEGKPFPPIKSLHEGYSIILEEVDEFWDEVKKKAKSRSKEALYKELIQISAMAQRTAEDLNLLPPPEIPF